MITNSDTWQYLELKSTYLIISTSGTQNCNLQIKPELLEQIIGWCETILDDPVIPSFLEIKQAANVYHGHVKRLGNQFGKISRGLTWNNLSIKMKDHYDTLKYQIHTDSFIYNEMMQKHESQLGIFSCRENC